VTAGVGGAVLGGVVVGGAVVGGVVVGGAVVGGACVVGDGDARADGVGGDAVPPEAMGQLVAGEGVGLSGKTVGTEAGVPLDRILAGLQSLAEVPGERDAGRHGVGLGVAPGRAEDGKVPVREPAAPPGDVPRVPVRAAARPPAPPGSMPGWSTPLPPVSTVALTSTSAARTGGTVTAAAVTETAAARPAASRIQGSPCDLRERASWTGARAAREAMPAGTPASQADMRAPRARRHQLATRPWSTR